MLSRVENENACKVAWVVHVNKVRTMITIFREEATSALAGLHAGPLSWSNWNLDIVFLWKEESQRTRRKTLRARREPTTNCSTHIWHRAGIKRSGLHRIGYFQTFLGFRNQTGSDLKREGLP